MILEYVPVNKEYEDHDIAPTIQRVYNLKGRLIIKYISGKLLVFAHLPIPPDVDYKEVDKMVTYANFKSLEKGQVLTTYEYDDEGKEVHKVVAVIVISNPNKMGAVLNPFVAKAAAFIYRVQQGKTLEDYKKELRKQ